MELEREQEQVQELEEQRAQEQVVQAQELLQTVVQVEEVPEEVVLELELAIPTVLTAPTMATPFRLHRPPRPAPKKVGIGVAVGTLGGIFGKWVGYFCLTTIELSTPIYS